MMPLHIFLLIILSIVMLAGGIFIGLVLGWEKGWDDCEETYNEKI